MNATPTTPSSINATVAGMDTADSAQAIDLLQERLVGTLDLALTLKHVHWNVVGMNFIAVHEMLDPQVDAVRAMSDAIAERIATLGGAPNGLAGNLASTRTWDDYPLSRDTSAKHLAAVDRAYSGVIEDHRTAQSKLAELDPVSEDMIIGQLKELELFQWFVRAHLMDSSGEVGAD